jgi:NAD(P)H-flavin reductase
MAAHADPMTPLIYRIEKVQKDTHDTFTLNLTHANGRAIDRFAPGQFNMLYVFGVGEVPISVSGDPYHPETLIHTTRMVGNVTKAMNALKPGETIGVRGPYGSHWPTEKAYGNDIVIVAGGIGLAPLRPVLYRVLANRNKYGKVVLLYGTRTPEDILYRSELEKLRARLDLDIHVTVDRATGNWKGNVGVVTKLIQRAPFDPYNTTAFVCGPEIMMRFTVRELENRGVEMGDIYVSMERNMKCAIGFCGHCQYGPNFICKDGPVFSFDKVKHLIDKREI